MCCFTRDVPFVGQTKIFARGLPDGRQSLAYAMKLDVLEELAMVLPLPVPPSSPEDAVEFVDLSGYPAFFTDLGKAFPAMMAFGAPQALRGGPVVRSAPLKVVEVGAFEASFVPRVQDFVRLDERFRLPPGFIEALPMYADYGFAVFRLKPTLSPRVDVHPMAFTFPRRDTNSLFFPTVHVHDGSVPANAVFDHTLVAQPSPLVAALIGHTLGAWQRSTEGLGAFVDAAKDKGLTDGGAVGYQLNLGGSLPNRDTWLSEPAGVTLADLAGEGDVFAWELRGATAFGPTITQEPQATWQETARTRLHAVATGMNPGISSLVARLSSRFSFAPLSVAKEPHHMNGRQLWTGTDYTNGKRGAGTGSGYVHFTPFTQQLEPQSVRIGFAKMPDEEGALEILRALEESIDRSLA